MVNSTTPSRKEHVVLNHLDAAVIDIKKAFCLVDANKREAQIKSVLFYWLGAVFDDATSEVNELKVALDITKQMVSRLKEVNDRLKEKLRKALLNSEEV